MIVCLFLAATAAKDVRSLMDAAVKANRGLKSGSFSIQVKQRLRGSDSDTHFDLDFIRPNKVRIRIKEGAVSGRVASNRTFALDGTSFVGYDPLADEYLRRKGGGKGSLGLQMANLMGGVDDAVKYALEPDDLALFLNNFSALKDWKITKQGPDTVCRRFVTDKGNVSDIGFRFDGRRGLLKSIHLSTKTMHLDISYAFMGPATSVAVAIPRSAHEVDAFYIRTGPPQYVSGKARDIGEGSVKAYQHIRSVAFRITEGTETISAWMSGKKLREVEPGFEWSYDGKSLTILDRNKKIGYRGVPTLAINNYVAKLGHRVDPTLKAIVDRKNPMAALLGPQMKVRLAGSVRIGNVMCDVLELTVPGQRISCQIRRSDHLLAAVINDNLDTKGHVMMSSERRFEYTPGPIADATFRVGIPKDFAVKALPLAKG